MSALPSRPPSSGAARHLLPARDAGRSKELPGVQVPANVREYVDVLGVDLAIEFLLTFGGAPLYLARRPQERGRLSQLVGQDKAAALYQATGGEMRRIPLAKEWIAKVLLTKGMDVAEIARLLRVSNVTVRGFTEPERKARDEGKQMRLL